MGSVDVRFARPPVKVVELTIFFDLIDGLQASHLAKLREMWREEYPQVSEQPPSSPPRHDPSRTPRRTTAAWPCPEVQFSSADGEEGFSIQGDRVIRRWYFGDREYPGFEKLSEDLLARLAAFEVVAREEVGAEALSYSAAQCWYVNEIEGLSDFDLAIGVLSNWQGNASPSKGGRWAVLSTHKCDDPTLDGCSVTTTVDGNHSNDWPILVIDVLTEDVREGEGPKELLGRAHNQLLNEFLQLANEDQLEQWGPQS